MLFLWFTLLFSNIRELPVKQQIYFPQKSQMQAQQKWLKPFPKVFGSFCFRILISRMASPEWKKRTTSRHLVWFQSQKNSIILRQKRTGTTLTWSETPGGIFFCSAALGRNQTKVFFFLLFFSSFLIWIEKNFGLKLNRILKVYCSSLMSNIT